MKPVYGELPKKSRSPSPNNPNSDSSGRKTSGADLEQARGIKNCREMTLSRQSGEHLPLIFFHHNLPCISPEMKNYF